MRCHATVCASASVRLQLELEVSSCCGTVLVVVLIVLVVGSRRTLLTELQVPPGDSEAQPASGGPGESCPSKNPSRRASLTRCRRTATGSLRLPESNSLAESTQEMKILQHAKTSREAASTKKHTVTVALTQQRPLPRCEDLSLRPARLEWRRGCQRSMPLSINILDQA